MEKVWEIKLVQKGHVEFKGSTAHSDEKVQGIVGNMNLKLRREELKLGVISIRVVSCKEPEMQLPKLNWRLRRVKKKGGKQLNEKRKEAVTEEVAPQHQEENVQSNKNRKKFGKTQSICCHTWCKAEVSFPISTDYTDYTVLQVLALS